MPKTLGGYLSLSGPPLKLVRAVVVATTFAYTMMAIVALIGFTKACWSKTGSGRLLPRG